MTPEEESKQAVASEFALLTANAELYAWEARLEDRGDYHVIYVRLAKPGGRTFVLRLECDDYPRRPPLAQFVSADSWTSDATKDTIDPPSFPRGTNSSSVRGRPTWLCVSGGIANSTKTIGIRTRPGPSRRTRSIRPTRSCTTFGPPFMIFGNKAKGMKPSAKAAVDTAALAAARVAHGVRKEQRRSGRRELAFGFERLFVPSIIRDYTMLLMRQHGLLGAERFLVWAGSPAGKDAVVTTVVVPRTDATNLHGEIPAEVVAALFESLDSRDLVPFAQLHTHPASARMSSIDRERPVVAIQGFLSIIVPNFAFTSDEPEAWNVYEYRARLDWLLWSKKDVAGRLVIDDSIVQVE